MTTDAELIAAKTRSISRMSTLQQALLSLFWFATNAHWTAILIVLLPAQVLQMAPEEVKGQTVGLILGLGAAISMLVAPLFGALSDRVRTRWGRRKPFLVVGVAGNILGLLALATIPTAALASPIPLYLAAFMVVELFNNVATAPYSALIPDLVPHEQRGSASGWMGLMTMLGSFVGGVAGLFLGIQALYGLLIVILAVVTLICVTSTHEPVPPQVPPFHLGQFFAGLFSPFRSRDFTWVFLTRFLVGMGTFTVQEFLQYYLRDTVGAPFILFGITVSNKAEQAVSFFITTLLIGAVISSLAAGVLSDRYGRKLMVYLSGALQGLVVAVFIFFHNYTLAVLMGVVFGLGYGAYQAVDWALASDVLPSEDDYAKDMGVWHVAFTLPQVVGLPIAGFLLDRFQVVGAGIGQPNLGYTVIFTIAVVYFILGTVFVRQIRSVR
ncbi:MAG: MFS transporter [Anaerolineae bacterium]|nr:MFS transporter [Anaerolineae bacterium]